MYVATALRLRHILIAVPGREDEVAKMDIFVRHRL